jgi:hypothetical protein
MNFKQKCFYAPILLFKVIFIGPLLLFISPIFIAMWIAMNVDSKKYISFIGVVKDFIYMMW